MITPAPIETEIPSLLDLPKAKLLTYPRESMVAEKFEAMISLGLANSRMKDFYDIWSLSRELPFESAHLSEAIKRTFARRGTQLSSGTPVVFTPEFFDDVDKQKQWSAFCNKNRSYVLQMTLESVCKEIGAFLMPLVEGLNGKGRIPKKWLDGSWKN